MKLTHNPQAGTFIQSDVGLASQRFFYQLRDIPVLSAEEERDLLAKAKSGDLRSRDKMVWHNMRLAMKVANKFKKYLIYIPTIGMPDLVQEGSTGIMKAIERFDLTSEGKFSTYASWWIYQRITIFLLNYARTVRISVSTQEAIRKVWKMSNKIELEKGYVPENEELADALEISPRRIATVRHAQKLMGLSPSLDQQFNGESDETRAQNVPDDDGIEADEEVDVQAMIREFQAVLKDLFTDERQLDIVRLRFGLGEQRGKQLRLREIGDMFGVTRERIRQIEKLALAALRKNPRTSVLARRYFGERFDTTPAVIQVRPVSIAVVTKAIKPEVDPNVNLATLAQELLWAIEVVIRNPRYVEILRWRLGLREQNEILSLQEIGNRFGITRERVRQIEQACLRKIDKHPSIAELLRKYLVNRPTTTLKPETTEVEAQLSKPEPASPVNAALILAKFYGIDVADLLTADPTPELVRMRHLAVYVLNRHGIPLDRIGSLFSRRKSQITLRGVCVRMERVVERSDKLQEDLRQMGTLLSAA